MCSACRKFTTKPSTTLRWLPLFMLLAALLAFPSSKALAQDCNPSLQLTRTSAATLVVIGDTVRIRHRMHANPSTGATIMTINNVLHDLDCKNTGSGIIPCVDENTTNRKSLAAGGGSPATDAGDTACQDAALANVTWTCGTVGNTVTCTPNNPVVLPINGTCDVSVSFTLDALSGTNGDLTPTVIEEDAQFTGNCDNTLNSQAFSTIAIPVQECLSGAICRQSAGACDPAELCTAGGLCPADVLEPNTTVCRASAGACDPEEKCTGASANCPADLKSTAVCRPQNGVCDVAENCNGTSNDCPADGFASTAVECRPVAGVCDVAENCSGTAAACPTDQFLSATTVCRPGDDATCNPTEFCTGTGATCPADVNPGCNENACRTVGYWQTHAGTEKNGAGINVTLNTLNLGGGSMLICGQTLTNTDVENGSSLLEGLCQSGGGQDQLARQLIALALNCIASGTIATPGSPSCDGNALFNATFDACNTTCASGTNQAISACIDKVDCLNNGGTLSLKSNGQFLCAFGTCSDDPTKTCSSDYLGNCGALATCNLVANCHSNPLFAGGVGDSPASSPDSCNVAKKSDCTIFNNKCDNP